MRNIVLITWDSVRADHCSCYGYDKETTPFLDKIARRGLKFENAIVRSLATPSSMSRIFIGKDHDCTEYLDSDWDCWRSLFRKNKTLPEILRNNGYHTGGFHGNPYVSKIFGFDRGFSEYRDSFTGGQVYRMKNIVKNILKKLNLLEEVQKIYNLIRGRGFYYLNDIYDNILRFVENSSNNFFLWILMTETHYPYVLPTWNRIKGAKIVRIVQKFEAGGGITKYVSLNEKERDTLIEAYDETINYADALTKQLWNDLKDTDPIFIVHADHGEAFGEHGFFGHPPEHYEYLIRVPLVIYNADVKGVVEEPVSLLRLAPTICELAGVENEFPQPSLLEDVEYSPPIVENKLEDGFRVTVRDREWKLIVNPDREDELYNIKKDPLEQENLIGQEPDIEKELRRFAEMHLKRRREEERLRAGIEKLKKRFR